MEMEEGQAYVTTTTTTSTTQVVTNLRYDPTYVKTLPGGLKIGQMVLNLLGYICICVSDRNKLSSAIWFSYISFGGFLITLALFILYLFHVIEKFYFVPWLLVEFVYMSAWTIFYLSGAIAVATWGGVEAAFAAAAFFGFAAMIAYGFDAFQKYRGWRGGEIAQGDRQVSKNTAGYTSAAF